VKKIFLLSLLVSLINADNLAVNFINFEKLIHNTLKNGIKYKSGYKNNKDLVYSKAYFLENVKISFLRDNIISVEVFLNDKNN